MKPSFSISQFSTLLILFLFCLGNNTLYAQKWQNPAEQYANAYKAYLQATCPIARDSIQHFVYFAKDRTAIKGHDFLEHSRFAGAQIMYSWKTLEPKEGQYDFTAIQADLEYLQAHNKQLFVQLQDATFTPEYKAVPNYILTTEYNEGVIAQYDDKQHLEGWVAKRWNTKIQHRFAMLLNALGAAFDGKINGINLQETAIQIDPDNAPDFSEETYIAGLKASMLALKQAFPISTTMIYANFVPGEWLPWNDKGYLRSLYQYGEKIGVGLGGPDLMMTRKGQLNNPLRLMHEGTYSVPIGIAIQDGNYIGKTGADADYNEYTDKGASSHKNIVPVLHAFAKEFLSVRYMFWVNQAPYFAKEVLPCFAE